MIYLITAVPGSGKSLRMVGMILNYLKEGRKVYANISGLNIDNVLPSPDDWRDTPEGSVVIYDEAQEIFPSNAKPGIVTDERLTAMERHRHTGHDLIFATQSPTFVHHHIRKLVGCHMHLYRPSGISGANIYTWSFASLDPNDRREQERADHVMWKFPREHFQYYKSATVHTHKFKIPKKIAVAGMFVLIGGCTVAYLLRDGLSFQQSLDKPVTVASGDSGAAAPPPALPITYGWSSQDSAAPVAGCVSSARGCQCYDIDLNTIDMSHAQCLSVISNPLPRRLLSTSQKGTRT